MQYRTGASSQGTKAGLYYSALCRAALPVHSAAQAMRGAGDGHKQSLLSTGTSPTTPEVGVRVSRECTFIPLCTLCARLSAAANMTAKRSSDINGLEDLAGRRVGTWKVS